MSHVGEYKSLSNIVALYRKLTRPTVNDYHVIFSFGSVVKVTLPIVTKSNTTFKGNQHKDKKLVEFITFWSPYVDEYPIHRFESDDETSQFRTLTITKVKQELHTLGNIITISPPKNTEVVTSTSESDSKSSKCVDNESKTAKVDIKVLKEVITEAISIFINDGYPLPGNETSDRGSTLLTVDDESIPDGKIYETTWIHRSNKITNLTYYDAPGLPTTTKDTTKQNLEMATMAGECRRYDFLGLSPAYVITPDGTFITIKSVDSVFEDEFETVAIQIQKYLASKYITEKMDKLQTRKQKGKQRSKFRRVAVTEKRKDECRVDE
jgi:hypothetical protein